MDDFKRQALQWDGATVHMKEPSGLLEQYNITERDMCKVVMKTAEPASTREATEQMVKILDSTNPNSDLKQVAYNTTQLNAEEITLLPSILEDFEDLLDGNLGDLATDSVNL